MTTTTRDATSICHSTSPAPGRALRSAAEWLVEAAGDDLSHQAAFAAADALLRAAGEPQADEHVSGATVAQNYQAAVDWLADRPTDPALTTEQAAAAIDALAYEIDRLNHATDREMYS